jgi:hypothetical protein
MTVATVATRIRVARWRIVSLLPPRTRVVTFGWQIAPRWPVVRGLHELASNRQVTYGRPAVSTWRIASRWTIRPRVSRSWSTAVRTRHRSWS